MEYRHPCCVPHQIAEEANMTIIRPNHGRRSIHRAVSQIGGHRASSLYGFPGIFYQRNWHTAGLDIFTTIKSFLEISNLPSCLNQIHITLITKNSNPISASDFWLNNLVISHIKSFQRSYWIDSKPYYQILSPPSRVLLWQVAWYNTTYWWHTRLSIISKSDEIQRRCTVPWNWIFKKFTTVSIWTFFLRC